MIVKHELKINKEGYASISEFEYITPLRARNLFEYFFNDCDFENARYYNSLSKMKSQWILISSMGQSGFSKGDRPQHVFNSMLRGHKNKLISSKNQHIKYSFVKRGI